MSDTMIDLKEPQYIKRIGPESPVLEEICPGCQETFKEGDEVVLCPDPSCKLVHHVSCWYLNQSTCMRVGCGQVWSAFFRPSPLDLLLNDPRRPEDEIVITIDELRNAPASVLAQKERKYLLEHLLMAICVELGINLPSELTRQPQMPSVDALITNLYERHVAIKYKQYNGLQDNKWGTCSSCGQRHLGPHPVFCWSCGSSQSPTT